MSHDDPSGIDGALRLAFGKRPGVPEVSPFVPAPGEPQGESAAESKGLRPGIAVGHFRVIERVGQGGMGELFLAHDEKLNRRVALKSIRARVRLSQEGRQRFHREAQILGRLDHGLICRIYDYVETDDVDFLVLEYIEGEPLSKALGARLPQGTAIDYGMQIAEALTAAHAQGVVHRDLKPSNLMVTPNGRIKVLDFGIARALADSGLADVQQASTGDPSSSPSEMTQVGAVMGTLDYMSPEQARGEKVTGATDVYALGLLLHEMWTGAKARPRDLAPLDMLRHIEADGRLPTDGVSSEARQLIDQMCAPLPTMRPTARAVGERLRWMADRPKRRLRAGILGGALLVAALGGLKYTLDLRTAHAATVANQERADRLIRFMHQDLWTKLDGVGQLEILEDVWEQSSEYFESIAAEDLSDEQLADHSRALWQIGTVRRVKRNSAPGSAERAFRASHELAVALLDRAPDNLDRRYEVGQAEYYLGEQGFMQRDYAAAEEWFGKYHGTSVALAAADPESEKYAMELAWSEHNLGALYSAQGRAADALGIFSKSAQVCRGFLEQHPGDQGWLEELGSSLSWLGKSALAAGDLRQARAGYVESMEVWQQLREGDKNQRQWALEWAVAAQQMATVEWLKENFHTSQALLQDAGVVLEELCAWDRINGEWARSLAINALFQGRVLMALERMPAAKERFEWCLAELERLVVGDEPSRDLDFQRAIVHVWLGEWALLSGDKEAAKRAADMGIEFLEASPQQIDESARVNPLYGAPWVARAEVVVAACSAEGDRQSALGRAAAALASHVDSSRDPRLLWPFVVVKSLQGELAVAEKWIGVLRAAGVAESTWGRTLKVHHDLAGN